MSIGELANFLKRKREVEQNKQIVNILCVELILLTTLLLLTKEKGRIVYQNLVLIYYCYT